MEKRTRILWRELLRNVCLCAICSSAAAAAPLPKDWEWLACTLGTIAANLIGLAHRWPFHKERRAVELPTPRRW